MKYRFFDGREFEASNAREVCVALWKMQKFHLHDTVEAWLEANANIMRNASGEDFPSHDFDAHVQKLIQTGILQRVCPSCGYGYTAPSAISRKDNKTEICPQCGMVEALTDFIKNPKAI